MARRVSLESQQIEDRYNTERQTITISKYEYDVLKSKEKGLEQLEELTEDIVLRRDLFNTVSYYIKHPKSKLITELENTIESLRKQIKESNKEEGSFLQRILGK